MVEKVIYAVGFSKWKRRPLRAVLFPDEIVFVSDTDSLPVGATLAVWGMREIVGDSEQNFSVLRIEDGFLRSVGLGTDLVRPVSWVVDGRGIYFNSAWPSDLEALLSESRFAADMVARAGALRQRIVVAGLTKYNVGREGWRRPPDGRRVILVPGQVESDASLTFGAPGIRTNLALLQAVRVANPGAYLVYKPHPDVTAGLRARGQGEDMARQWCDEIVLDGAMNVLLDQVDDVHVLTSLAGFEALLRGKPVTCYGQPFYAGWGLTHDKEFIARRTRRLSLDELVAGALILYPRYMSRRRDGLISPEEAIEELLEWRARCGSGVPWWRRLARMVLRQVVGVR